MKPWLSLYSRPGSLSPLRSKPGAPGLRVKSSVRLPSAGHRLQPCTAHLRNPQLCSRRPGILPTSDSPSPPSLFLHPPPQIPLLAFKAMSKGGAQGQFCGLEKPEVLGQGLRV